MNPIASLLYSEDVTGLCYMPDKCSPHYYTQFF